MDMEKFVRQSLLYDFYGELLTEHQKEIYSLYVMDNMSLSEIASDRGISRQGVFDLIKRCDVILNDYEEKLHLLSRFMGVKEKINALTKDLKSMADDSKTGKVLDSSLDEIVLRLGNIVDEL